MAQKKMKNLLTGGLFTDEISSEGVIFHRQTGNPGKKKTPRCWECPVKSGNKGDGG